MVPVRPAERAAPAGGLNAIARARADMVGRGVALVDLSDSNPTRHGLMLPGILDVVQRHVLGAARYEPDPRGPLAARNALAERFGGRPVDYWLTSSTSQAYSWLLMLLADPGQQVAIPAPGYPLIEPIARLTGVGTAAYQSHYVHPHGWILDRATLLDATADPATRAVVVVNPGNPTGAYLGPAADTVLDVCRRRRAALISDEVFAPFALDGAAQSVTPHAARSDVPTFTLGGLSKLLCAPQLKLGWIRISGPASDLARLADGLDAIADAFLPVSAPVAAALPDLLELADQSVAGTRKRLSTNLSAARATFSTGPYRVRRCEGGWTVLVDVPRYLPAEQLAVHLVRRAHLLVHPGWFYDLPDEGALAVSLLPEPDRFVDGLRRLRAALDDLG